MFGFEKPKTKEIEFVDKKPEYYSKTIVVSDKFVDIGGVSKYYIVDDKDNVYMMLEYHPYITKNFISMGDMINRYNKIVIDKKYSVTVVCSETNRYILNSRDFLITEC